MNRKLLAIGLIILVITVITATSFSIIGAKTDLNSIKSMKDLERRYVGDSDDINVVKFMSYMPWSFLLAQYMMPSFNSADSISRNFSESSILNESSGASQSSLNLNTSSKDYSTTNIQVENVDEADIIKTDGNYIYSLSDNNVIITNVIDEKSPIISSKITIDSGFPQDLILFGDKLVVISSTNTSIFSRNGNTLVETYDITDKGNPNKIKSYSLHEPYYTSRCIGNKLYVISNGSLRKKDENNIDVEYEEDNKTKTIDFKNIKYFTDIKTDHQTLISFMDLDNPTADISVNSYLIDISNAYVSETGIYLADYGYTQNNTDIIIPLRTLFGFYGVLGPARYWNDSSNYSSNINNNLNTKLYKFDILDNGSIKYSAKTKVKGKTINQFSFDEYQGNFRVALWDRANGSRVVVFDNKLQEIGHSSYLAKGEDMYSSRFIGNKVYLVTYLNTDPLYVIDLSDPTNPTVLGELKIPGYSTYLHPYDENHLIGFGMESEEIVNRDSYGRVTFITANIIGMKMALFDVSDVNNPTQIANTVIGDRRTTSSILKNHKALLFSKEKGLLAIPVNNYLDDFKISDSSNRDTAIKAYTNYNKPYISEGYFVYDINTTNGFTKKGTITHDVITTNTYSYYNNSKLLRGVYINDNLFTVSESMLKINNLNDLEQISELKIK